MIHTALYIIFVLVSFSMVAWGFLKKDRLFQYPTVAGISWLVFFGPQAFGAIANPNKYPGEVLEDGGLSIALVMLILCAAAGWLGYYCAGRSKRAWHFPRLSSRQIFWAGAGLCAIAVFSGFRLAQLTGGFASQFTEGGHYALEWRGEPVKYLFFVELIYLGLPLALLSALRRPSWSKFFACVLMMIYPAAVSLYLGRRTRTAILASIVLLSLFFSRKLEIPRIVYALLTVAAFLAVYYGPAYRSQSQYGLDYGAIRASIAEYDGVGAVLRGEKDCEFDTLVYWSAAVNKNVAFAYGADFYNQLIRFYVPGQLVGYGVKESLFLRGLSEEARDLAYQLYRWKPGYGWFETGPYTAFRQFWYLGCMLYFVLGFVFRFLWKAAHEKRNLAAQIWYVWTVVLIPLSISSSITSVPARLLIMVIVMWFVSMSCQERLLARSRIGASAPGSRANLALRPSREGVQQFVPHD